MKQHILKIGTNNKSIKYLMSTVLSGLLALTFVTHSAYAHEQQSELDTENIKLLYESLDPSGGMPKGVTKKSIVNFVKKAGGNDEDIKFLLSTYDKDICSFPEIAALCAYMGRDTLNKVSNYSIKLREAGASNDEINESASQLIGYGIMINLERIYSDKGMRNDSFEKLTPQNSLNNDYFVKPDSRSFNKGLNSSKRKLDHKRFLCLGLNVNVDTQNIASTNPLYGRNYRMVNCSAGLNWRWAFRFLGMKLSIQTGFAISHSRFARKIVLWHLTGADEHICATADVLGSVTNKCNSNNWSSPVALKFKVIFNRSRRNVIVRGHAHKLGHSFNTSRSY